MNYKELHEASLTGLTGGTLQEIGLILFIIPLTIFFHRLVILSFYSTQPPANISRFITDFATTVLPMILCFTMADYLMVILLVLVIFALLLISMKRNLIVLDNKEQLQSLSGSRKPFLSEYRSAIFINTFVAILAVDFPVFPRRFAKTETYGHSVMDIGVGSFLFANSLISQQAKGSSGGRSSLFSTMQSVTPLLILGFSRLLSVKAANYQEHVSEYGVHWNFFFTLAFVALLISVLDVPVEYNAVGGIALILLYQCALSKFGLAEYIEHHPRSNLWHQNREGILSSIGYTSLYLLGARLGREIWKPRSTMTEWRRFTLQLWIVDTICWIVTLVSDHYVVAASRRMANLTYVLSVMAINVQNIASALTIACITRPVSNCITEAVNYNGLAIFLLANIATGLVNMSIATIYTSDAVAVGILLLYMIVVTGIAVLLYRRQIHLKFW